MTVFLAWPFKASGPSTTPRAMPDRLADMVNVKDYGAPGDGSDQTSALQAAIDAAFGSSSSPHGTSAHLNRVLRIPNGDYLISAPLVFTEVKGGHIAGDGLESVTISGATSIFTFNGCEDTMISGLRLSTGAKSTSNGRHGVKLDAGSILGLKNVTIFDVLCDGGQYGIRVAPGGVGGDNVLLMHTQTTTAHVGLSIEGADCNVRSVGGSAAECNTGIWVQNGNHVCNFQFAGAAQLDIKHDSTGSTTVYGTRSESPSFCNVTAGVLSAFGVLHQAGPVGDSYSVNVTSPGVVQLTSCQLGEGSHPAQSWITGTGKVFLRNVHWDNGSGPIFLSSFTGKICECLTDAVFTFAQLPPAAEGLTLSLSNSNTATWGATITTTGANHVLTRYNGTNWTVVGK